MGKGRRYDQEYKDMIVELFKSGMSLAELSSEYGIAKSTINGWVVFCKCKFLKFADKNGEFCISVLEKVAGCPAGLPDAS